MYWTTCDRRSPCTTPVPTTPTTVSPPSSLSSTSNTMETVNPSTSGNKHFSPCSSTDTYSSDDSPPVKKRKTQNTEQLAYSSTYPNTEHLNPGFHATLEINSARTLYQTTTTVLRWTIAQMGALNASLAATCHLYDANSSTLEYLDQPALAQEFSALRKTQLETIIKTATDALHEED